MNIISIKELFKNTDAYIGKDVEVGGWLRSIRDSKTFGFIVLSDGTYFDTLQVVYSDKLDNFNEICKLNVGAAIIVKGNATEPLTKPLYVTLASYLFLSRKQLMRGKSTINAQKLRI